MKPQKFKLPFVPIVLKKTLKQLDYSIEKPQLKLVLKGDEPKNLVKSMNECTQEDKTTTLMEQEIQVLMNKIGFDYQTTSELLETFIEQMRCGVDDMKALVADLEYERIARKAHQLKGAAAAVRIERLRESIEGIERDIQKRDIQRVNQLINTIMEDPLMRWNRGDDK